MKEPEAFRGERLLDWLESTMNPAERERMLALPDSEPTSPGEVERRQWLEVALSSIPEEPPPPGLWNDVLRRVEASRAATAISASPPSSPAPTTPPATIIRRIASGIRTHRSVAAGIAATLLVALTLLFAGPILLGPGAGGPEGGTGERWVVMDVDENLGDAGAFEVVAGFLNGGPHEQYARLVGPPRREDER